jgi:PD-(D/E)XK nuclease superfamily protein
VATIEDYRDLLHRYAQTCDARNRSYWKLLERGHGFVEQQRDRNRLRPPMFNVFHALGHAYREVSTHSAMLAHLLDPTASHCQGPLFLQGLLDKLQIAGQAQGLQLGFPHIENASTWSCRKEVNLPGALGRVDIVIRGPTHLIVIENKVRASLGEDQLDRYWAYAQEKARQDGSRPVIVYLTPDGREAVGKVEIPRASLISLSYRYDLYPLFDQAALSCKAVSVSEIVLQYAALIRDLQ